MPCDVDSHDHKWPESGDLTIERCEVYCNYCTGENKRHRWKFAWFLRRHVQAVHIDRADGSHKNVILAEMWTRNGKSTKNARPATRKKAPKRIRRSPIVTRASHSRTPSYPGSEQARLGDTTLDSFVADQSSGDEQQQELPTELQPVFDNVYSFTSDGIQNIMNAFPTTTPCEANDGGLNGSSTLDNFTIPGIDLDTLAEQVLNNGIPANIDSSLLYDLTATPDFAGTLLDPDLSRFTTPPPSFSSGSDTSSTASPSPIHTPQRRIGERLKVEYPLTPTSTEHYNAMREQVNAITAMLEERGAKEGVLAAALITMGSNYADGVPF